MSLFSGSDIGSQMGEVFNQQQLADFAGQKQINSDFSGFTPQWYAKAQQGYVNNQLPSVYQQGLQGMQNLGFTDANRGLYNSSAQNHGQQLLSGQIAQGQRQVAGGAIDYRNQLQMMNQQERAALMQQLQSSMQPYQQMQSLLGQAGAMGTPNPMQPLMGFAQSLGSVVGGTMAGG